MFPRATWIQNEPETTRNCSYHTWAQPTRQLQYLQSSMRESDLTPTPHWQHSLKELFVFQINGGFQTAVVFFLSTYITSLSLTTGWGLIPGIYLFRLAARSTLLKTYFNEMPVRWNNNLYWDVLIGFERSSLRLERIIQTCSGLVDKHIVCVPLSFEQRLKTDAWPQQYSTTEHQDALRLWGLLKWAFTSRSLCCLWYSIMGVSQEGLSPPLYLNI